MIKAKLKHGIIRVLRKIKSVLPLQAEAFEQALALVGANNCNLEEFVSTQQNFDRVGNHDGNLVCNWYLPYFDNAYYGGIMTILRFASYLHTNEKIDQRFLICSHGDQSHIRNQIEGAFPELRGSEVIMLDSAETIQQIPSSDYSIATLWTTAYVLLKVKNTGLKFYFVQDYEPLFYAAGSTYAQAELPYWFGFYGITNTVSLKNIYQDTYGGEAEYLTPCVDRRVFYPPATPREKTKKKLFLYARPGAPRNGFELTLTAIKLLKQKYKDSIEVVCAGGVWDPADYGLEGVISNLGVLSYEQTGELYRTCHIGFVMMMTKHPSYLPFEFMASGTLVVTNYNPANLWFLKDGENCLLSPASASCLFDSLSYALDNYDDLESIRENALQKIDQKHSDWNTELQKIAGFLKSPDRQPTKKIDFFVASSIH